MVACKRGLGSGPLSFWSPSKSPRRGDFPSHSPFFLKTLSRFKALCLAQEVIRLSKTFKP